MRTVVFHIPLALGFAALLGAAAHAQTPVDIDWIGSTNGSESWHDPSFWNPNEEPDNNGTHTYNVTVSDLNALYGADISQAVTLDNLTVEGMNVGISNNGAVSSADLTVLGTTTFVPTDVNGVDFYGYLEVRESDYRLGNFTNFSVLPGDYGVLGPVHIKIETAAGAGPTAYLKFNFNGAVLKQNDAFLELLGAGAVLADQQKDGSGLENSDELANLVVNNGELSIGLGRQLTLGSGDFTNNGTLILYAADPITHQRSLLEVQHNFINNGSIEFLGEGQLIVHGTTTQNGDLTVSNNSTFEINGIYSQNTGTLTLGGTGSIETWLMTAERIDLAAGTTFGGRGTILADLVEGGIFAPGASPGSIRVEGDITLQASCELRIEIGGLNPDTQFDQILQITQSGGDGVTLGGTLDISFVNGFESAITAGDIFAILVSDQTLAGAFSNIASGARLATSDQLGSFLVTYSGSQVLLSQFLPVPEPAVMPALTMLLLPRRRRAIPV